MHWVPWSSTGKCVACLRQNEGSEKIITVMDYISEEDVEEVKKLIVKAIRA
ncbi:hypothetical protein ES703_28550 [subsurface metagenome]